MSRAIFNIPIFGTLTRRLLNAFRISQVRQTYPEELLEPMITERIPAHWSSIEPAADDFDAVYRAFGKAFRGPEDVVKEREAHFIPYVKEAVRNTPPGLVIADLGCGRGEFLDLMSAAGVPYVGVETSESQASELTARGRKVVVADANSFLESRDDHSLAGVVSFAVLEHMAPDYVVRFLQLIGRKVAPGGCVLIQSSNPECFAEIAAFWVDVTHVRPYHPQMVAFYLYQQGFSDMRIAYSLPSPWPMRLTGSQSGCYLAYTVIGAKSAAPSNTNVRT